jgi:hypothetical protein
MTQMQVKKMSELLHEGWTSVPDTEHRMGVSMMKSPEGVMYHVNGDGSLEQLATAAR